MHIRTSIKDGLKDFSADEVRVMVLEAMDGLRSLRCLFEWGLV